VTASNKINAATIVQAVGWLLQHTLILFYEATSAIKCCNNFFKNIIFIAAFILFYCT